MFWSTVSKAPLRSSTMITEKVPASEDHCRLSKERADSLPRAAFENHTEKGSKICKQ